MKTISINDGVLSINFCDKYNKYFYNFKQFKIAKFPNPHYLPEIWIKLTVINFTVAFEGLEDQILVYVVIHEKPETQKERIHFS